MEICFVIIQYFSIRPKLSKWFLANVNSRYMSLYVVVRPSVCLSSVVCLSVTFVHTQAIFGNVSTPFNTFAI